MSARMSLYALPGHQVKLPDTLAYREHPDD